MGMGIPMYASSAHFAIRTLRHPELCGVMTIFGVPDDIGQDSKGYIDPHGEISFRARLRCRARVLEDGDGRVRPDLAHVASWHIEAMRRVAK